MQTTCKLDYSEARTLPRSAPGAVAPGSFPQPHTLQTLLLLLHVPGNSAWHERRRGDDGGRHARSVMGLVTTPSAAGS